jgi:ribosomal protein S18 acetylase RimI-like enzyme
VISCAPAAVLARAAPEGIRLSLAYSDVDLRQVAEAQNDAYGQQETTDLDVARLRGTVEGGGLVALAIDVSTGRGVGSGFCAPPHGGVSELAAIGVLGAYRRRGIAAALTSLLTRACASASMARRGRPLAHAALPSRPL